MGLLSLPGQAVPRSCVPVLAGAAACPCPAGAEGNGGPIPSPVLSKPQGFQLRGGGKRRGLLCPGAGDLGALWGSARRRDLPFSGCGALTRLSVSSCRRRRRSR